MDGTQFTGGVTDTITVVFVFAANTETPCVTLPSVRGVAYTDRGCEPGHQANPG
jgi:hypothetical protein